MQSAPRAPLNLNGRITTSTFARLNIPFLVGPPVILAASRIKTTSYAKLGDVLALTARARATSQGRTNLLTLAQLDTVLLTGSITTISRSQIRPFTASLVKNTFDGRIKTASSAQTWLIRSILSGTLAGQIRTTGQARIELTQPSPSILVGRIRAASSAIFSALPTRDLVGQISTTSFATISQANERLSASIYTSSRLTLNGDRGVPKDAVRAATTANIVLSDPQIIDGIAVVANDRVLVKNQATQANNGIYLVQTGAWVRVPDMDAWAEVPSAYVWVATGTVNSGTGWICTSGQGGTLGTTAITWIPFTGLAFRTLLTGQIATTTWANLPPTQALLFGRIRANSYGIIPQLPLLPQFQPVVCPIDVDLGDYIDLITSEHISKPKYIQTVTNTVQPYVDDQKIVNGFPCLFDVDVAVGEQEDFTGQWIGKSRYVNLGDVFFSWDVRGLGWDESNWRGPFDPPNSLAVLDDEHYRLLLYASIVANHWDGSIPSAYTAWDTLFAGTGYQVVIQDFGNMTMMLGLRGTGTIDAVTQALFQNGNMDLKPAGVSLIDYVFQAQPSVPFFAFDASTDAASGWDVGYWGYLVPPGQGFVPGKTF